MINLDTLVDGFYFIKWLPADQPGKEIISVIAVFNEKNEVLFLGDSKADTIGQLVDMMKAGKIKLISKIEMP